MKRLNIFLVQDADYRNATTRVNIIPLSLPICLSISFSIQQFLLEEPNPYRRILRIPCCHPRAQKITTENSYDRRPRAKKVL